MDHLLERLLTVMLTVMLSDIFTFKLCLNFKPARTVSVPVIQRFILFNQQLISPLFRSFEVFELLGLNKNVEIRENVIRKSEAPLLSESPTFRCTVGLTVRSKLFPSI